MTRLYFKLSDLNRFAFGRCGLERTVHLVQPVNVKGYRWMCVKCGELLKVKGANIPLDSPVGKAWKLKQAEGKPQ